MDQERTRKFAFQTLATATRAAQERAQLDAREHFVVEVINDFSHLQHRTVSGIPPHTVNFAWCERGLLRRMIESDAPEATGCALTILRVAHPDGTVEAVRDPGDRAGRLAAFCHMTDEERDAHWEGRP